MVVTASWSSVSFPSRPEVDLIPRSTSCDHYHHHLRGAGPKEVESQVTEKIEDEVSTVSNVKSINSTSMEYVSLIVVEFIVGTDVDLPR